ncbi:hypothetical protein MGYG_02291 [Nannizzia gypsea CBS 118893]|uniref:Uncharacterized protein n=1 Tax=Arthroderma gypseum (strain ATCC MYA-4604 / CBS 118893) TaxID=535722 RepID=E4UQV2_ARTGP|nr:hypothetical protein MGYG_02291 [Nannizzia gypsea CBS 118893]EFQ99278.1 hypothetical protein MGYG_02291 [Nannizzia gypsea CBS 118893]
MTDVSLEAIQSALQLKTFRTLRYTENVVDNSTYQNCIKGYGAGKLGHKDFAQKLIEVGVITEIVYKKIITGVSAHQTAHESRLHNLGPKIDNLKT